MPAFEKTNDLDDIVAQVITEFYPTTLAEVDLTVDVLWHVSEDGLQLRGRPCYAYVKPQGAREKANGASDVLMVVDRRAWDRLTPEQRLALVDHELQHIEPKKAKDGSWKMDDHGRPRLTTRGHDIEVGWFLTVARRHGQNAIEVQQAQDLLDKHRNILFQLELPFGDPTAGTREEPVNVVQMEAVEERGLAAAGKFPSEEEREEVKPKKPRAPRGGRKAAANA